MQSMTGQGVGQSDYSGGGSIVAEVRSVNNKHLKISLRASPAVGGFESSIESYIRARVRRGSFNVNVFWQNQPVANWYRIQAAVLERYVQQFHDLGKKLDIKGKLRWADLVGLPGVVAEAYEKSDDSLELEQAVLAALGQALDGLEKMRLAEGLNMKHEFSRQLAQLRELADRIGMRAPQVLADYRERLRSRVSAAIAEALGDRTPGKTKKKSEPLPANEDRVRDSDLVREVALMTDKADVREEIVRLQSHFSQFDQLLGSSESQGRRLDFLVQEMFREANTIGSKAGDAEIAQHVIEIKTTLEQIRELVQNVE